MSIKVTTEDAKKQVTQLQKEIESLQKKINAKQTQLNITNGALDGIRNDTRQGVIKDMPDAGAKRIGQQTELRLVNNSNYMELVKQSDKLNNEIMRYNSLLDSAKSKVNELGGETSKTASVQNKSNNFASLLKGKISQVSGITKGLKGSFNQIPKITQKITNNIKGMGKGLKQGVGHILKYATALFSLRSIYSTLSSSANSWLSSQNSQAQQLSANIEYMKYAMGSVFAPVIEYITNLVYQLMKAIQSVVYAFSGINIFAKATASSMKNTSKSAKDTNKSLSSVHSEINNVSENNNSRGDGNVNPSMDLSKVDGQMNGFAQKLYDFFKPLKDSWDSYGTGLVEQVKSTAGQVGGLISSVWGSFENIITNGTVYSILENILAIIGNIAEAFSNAWNYNGNGDAIIQNLANAFNNLLTAINNVIQSPAFQEWLNWCSDKFREISEKIASINWQPLIEALSNIGKTVGTIALDGLSWLVDIFKWLVENPEVIVTLLGIVAAIKAWSIAQGILNAVMNANPITLIITLIGLLALAIVEIVKNWEQVGEFFSNLWQGICDIFSNIGQWFSDRFSEAVEGIKNVFSNIGNFFSGVWHGICNVFGNVTGWFRDKFSQAWQAVKNVFSKGGQVFDGIKDGILNGLKTVINAIIKGINKVIAIPFNGLNTALKKIRDVSIFDFKPFSWISTLSVPQIPQLAKGGVLYDESIVKVAEYSGARNNPEIVTPQNIMYDTMLRALSDSNLESNNDRPLNVTINVGNTKIGQILLDNLRDMKRQTGKDIEALVGG